MKVYELWVDGLGRDKRIRGREERRREEEKRRKRKYLKHV